MTKPKNTPLAATPPTSSKRQLKTARAQLHTRPRAVSVTADPLPPVNEGAKVKLDLSSRNNDNLMSFASQHDKDMAGNALYPNPTPSTLDYDAVLTDYNDKLVSAMSARSAAVAATNALNVSRVAMEDMLNKRGNYVQIASNSNVGAILSAGFDVRAARTPATPLTPPTGLVIDLNGISGVMLLSWVSDPYASGYAAQYSENVTPRIWQSVPRTSKAKLSLSDMTVGTIYVFQVAALGGSTGQSPWCPEVSRAAA